MAAPDTAPALLSQPALETLLHLEGRARAATRLTTLGFTLTNESLALFPYRQAALFLCDRPSNIARSPRKKDKLRMVMKSGEEPGIGTLSAMKRGLSILPP